MSLMLLCANGLAEDRIALTLWGEARGEDLKGKHLVASVIWNRGKGNAAAMDKLCKAPAFSCWLVKQRPKTNSAAWKECVRIARDMRSGRFRPLSRATHYHAKTCKPYWAPSLQLALRHGGHVFYYAKGRKA